MIMGDKQKKLSGLRLISGFFIVLFLIACAKPVYAQQKELKFDHLSKEDGLSSSDVTSVVQDQQGFIWIGTIDGLNRYDGYTIKTYRNIPEEANSLCDNRISVLYIDHLGDLWIGTENNGISKYDRDTDTFINYTYKAYDSKSLSYYYVTSIVEDAENNIWIGTLSGLNLFNRNTQQFTQYLRSIRVEIAPEATASLKERGLPEKVLAALRQLHGKSFESAESLLHELKPTLIEAEIEQYKAAIFASASFETTAEIIRSLEHGADNRLWLGFEHAGLGLFDPASKKLLKRYSHSAAEANSLSSDEVMSLQVDGDQLWIGTRDGGLNRFDTRQRRFHRYPHTREQRYIKCLFKDSKNNIWFGDGEGLVRYQRDSDSFYRYAVQTNLDPFGLSTLFVSAIAEDAQGNLWVGCDQGGVSMTTIHQPFLHLTHQVGNPASLSKKGVSAVLKDSKGNLWVGYFSMGIDFWDAKTGAKTQFNHHANDPGSVGEGTVFKIFEDSYGKIWIGTYRGGLQYFDETTRKFVAYRHNPQDSGSISGDDVRDIAEDKERNLWIAVHGGGINKFKRETNTFYHYRADYAHWRNSLSNDWVHTVLCDSRGRIWAGSVSGISVLRPGNKDFESYNHNNSNLSHNSVRAIFEDNSRNIWIGTENGLNLFDEQKKHFTIYTEKDGLPNNFIMGGVSDKTGSLWISTNNGLSKFDPQIGAFRNYSYLDGLQSNEFFPGAYYKSSEDEFFFGGKNGLNSFNPNAIKDNAYRPPVLITDFKLFNQEVAIGGKGSPLQKQVSQTGELVLSHDQNVMSFGFVGMNYIRPEKNQYAYKLEGFEKNWNYVGNKREATYTNLDPGEYEFRVMASNNDGIWNEQGASLKILVLAPWWKTKLAYAAYFLLLVLGLVLGRHLMLQRARARFLLEQERREARQLHELDLMKMRFFTNISHEFRTPLALILAPIDKLLGQLNQPEHGRQLEMIQRNAKRLLQLVNQLLDFRKLELEVLGYYPSRGNIVKFVKESVSSFGDLAEKKHINLRFESCFDELQTSFDMDKLEKVLFNLLSNAYKFTPEGGDILVELSLQQAETAFGQSEALTGQSEADLKPTGEQQAAVVGALQIKVKDTGIGIASDKLQKVFERFYRADVPASMINQGSGIGLAITKEFVKMHGGAITVESEPGKGSCFTVSLPLLAPGQQPFQSSVTRPGEARPSVAPTQEEVFIPAESGPAQTDTSLLQLESIAVLIPEAVQLPASASVIENSGTSNSAVDLLVSKKNTEPKSGVKLPEVLLVEDNEDFRQYLKDSLSEYFTIIEAKHGKEGWQKALAQMPDLIVSDLMMPELNGIEFCQKIKADARTSHIPFVLLTAHSAEEKKLKGLDIGANDYITKPFNFELLLSRLRNLIAQRQLMQQVFEKKISVETSQAEIVSLDDKLMQKVIQLVEQNLSESDFSVEQLSRELGMSRAHLYKKMVSITGKSPVEFIRRIRLERAAQYLEKSQLTVAEVAYRVGFNNAKYFTKYFKEAYNVLPSQYASHCAASKQARQA